MLDDEYKALLARATEGDRLTALVNNAQTADFLEATRLEAAHQVERWGEAHDRDKSAENWFWLVGYLAGKCLRACITGDKEKALHHTISAAAALCNWHKAITADTTGSGQGSDLDIKPVEIARFEDNTRIGELVSARQRGAVVVDDGIHSIEMDDGSYSVAQVREALLAQSEARQ